MLQFNSTRTYGSAKCFGKNLGLLHLRTVHLRADHGAERHLRAELLRDRERERRLPRPRRADEQQRAPRELARLDEVYYNPTCLHRKHTVRCLLNISFTFRSLSFNIQANVPRVLTTGR